MTCCLKSPSPSPYRREETFHHTGQPLVVRQLLVLQCAAGCGQQEGRRNASGQEEFSFDQDGTEKNVIETFIPLCNLDTQHKRKEGEIKTLVCVSGFVITFLYLRSLLPARYEVS